MSFVTLQRGPLCGPDLQASAHLERGRQSRCHQGAAIVESAQQAQLHRGRLVVSGSVPAQEHAGARGGICLAAQRARTAGEAQQSRRRGQPYPEDEGASDPPDHGQRWRGVLHRCMGHGARDLVAAGGTCRDGEGRRAGPVGGHAAACVRRGAAAFAASPRALCTRDAAEGGQGTQWRPSRRGRGAAIGAVGEHREADAEGCCPVALAAGVRHIRDGDAGASHPQCCARWILVAVAACGARDRRRSRSRARADRPRVAALQALRVNPAPNPLDIRWEYLEQPAPHARRLGRATV